MSFRKKRVAGGNGARRMALPTLPKSEQSIPNGMFSLWIH